MRGGPEQHSEEEVVPKKRSRVPGFFRRLVAGGAMVGAVLGGPAPVGANERVGDPTSAGDSADTSGRNDKGEGESKGESALEMQEQDKAREAAQKDMKDAARARLKAKIIEVTKKIEELSKASEVGKDVDEHNQEMGEIDTEVNELDSLLKEAERKLELEELRRELKGLRSDAAALGSLGDLAHEGKKGEVKEELSEKQREFDSKVRKERQRLEIAAAKRDARELERSAEVRSDEAKHLEKLAKVRSKAEKKKLLAEGDRSYKDALAHASRVEVRAVGRNVDWQTVEFLNNSIAGYVSDKSDPRALFIEVETVHVPASSGSEEQYQVQVFGYRGDDKLPFVTGVGSRQRAHGSRDVDTRDDVLKKGALNEALRGLTYIGPAR